MPIHSDGAIPNTIVIGNDLSKPLYTFTNNELSISKIKGQFSYSIFSNELPIDTLTITVKYKSDVSELIYRPLTSGQEVTYTAGYVTSDNKVYALSKRGRKSEQTYLKNLKNGTAVWWFCGTTMIAKFYLQSFERTNKNAWTIKCMSAIGLLEDKIHVGGIYTGQTFDQVFHEIVGDTFGYGYEYGNEQIGELQVFGWLPYDSARNNLHRLLFAFGAILFRGFTYLPVRE